MHPRNRALGLLRHFCVIRGTWSLAVPLSHTQKAEVEVAVRIYSRVEPYKTLHDVSNAEMTQVQNVLQISAFHCLRPLPHSRPQ
jgi:hypothetical protein